jgi:hypothetical protein
MIFVPGIDKSDVLRIGLQGLLWSIGNEDGSTTDGVLMRTMEDVRKLMVATSNEFVECTPIPDYERLVRAHYRAIPNSSAGEADVQEYETYITRSLPDSVEVVVKTLTSAILAPIVEQSVVISNWNMECAVPRNDLQHRGKFVVHIGTGLLECNSVFQRPCRIIDNAVWGMIPQDTRAFSADTDKGVEHLWSDSDSDEPDIVADIYQNACMVHLNLLCGTTAVVIPLYMEFILALAEHMAKKRDKLELFKKLCERMFAPSEEWLKALETKRMSYSVQHAIEVAEAHKREERSCKERYIRIVSNRIQAEKELASLYKRVLEGTDRTISMIDKIHRIAGVKSAFYIGDVLMVHTDTIRVKDVRTGYTHELGRFTIVIDYYDEGPIRFYNKDRQVRAYQSSPCQAPHVFLDGDACFGNIEISVSELMASREDAVLVSLLISFLSSVNVSDDAGQYVNRWPRVTDTGELIEWDGEDLDAEDEDDEEDEEENEEDEEDED